MMHTEQALQQVLEILQEDRTRWWLPWELFSEVSERRGEHGPFVGGSKERTRIMTKLFRRRLIEKRTEMPMVTWYRAL